jgi:hypothetical protein
VVLGNFYPLEMLSILDEIITRDGGDCEFHFDYRLGILASLMVMRTLKRFQFNFLTWLSFQAGYTSSYLIQPFQALKLANCLGTFDSVGDIGGLFVTSCTGKITIHKRASLGKRNRAGKMSMKAIFKCTMHCHVWLQSAMSIVHRKALH